MTALLEQSLIWLSLLGAVHCLGLALYLRFIHQPQDGNHRLLANIIAVLALSFLSGLINRCNLSLHLPLVYSLFLPGYFLLMPLLYQYCSQSLGLKTNAAFWQHYLPAPLVGIGTAIMQAFTPGLMYPGSEDWITRTDYTPLVSILTGLFMLQAVFYYPLIFRLLLNHNRARPRQQASTLKDIRFRWLICLSLALMMNWLLNVMLTLVPVYLGEGVSRWVLIVPKLMLLFSLYLLGLFGLKQLTQAAFLRGKESQLSVSSPSSQSPLLSDEELAFIQELMQAEPTSTKTVTQTTQLATI